MGDYYIGVMSGTSMDGIDVVLCLIDDHACKPVDAGTYPFPLILKEKLLSAITGLNSLETISDTDHLLGVTYATAINDFLCNISVKRTNIKAIGLHGQTLWHAPNEPHPTTMQLGDPTIVAVETGIPVVADLRRKDIALGGEGAPLAPAFHAFLYRERTRRTAIVNIGGMANITILDKKMIGYDTGPGNVLMDLWITRHQAKGFDQDGAWAQSGTLQADLLEAMLEESYFHQPYPKSTGREKFNLAWIEQHTTERFKPEDLQRTLLELTAVTIAKEAERFHTELLVLCGGGVKNSFLVNRIRSLLPETEVAIAEDAEMLEAMMMAWLAYMRLHEKEVNIKEVTGARSNTILGALYA